MEFLAHLLTIDVDLLCEIHAFIKKHIFFNNAHIRELAKFWQLAPICRGQASYFEAKEGQISVKFNVSISPNVNHGEAIMVLVLVLNQLYQYTVQSRAKLG